MHRVDCARLLAEGSPDALVLAVLCDLYAVVKEEQTMLSEVLITELPSYGLGMERGMERGEQLMLSRLLQKRFGPLPPRIQAHLEAASTTELEAWAEQVLDGIGLEQIFPDA